MHTSFEDLRLKEGNIGRIVDGELIWERPRTRREVGYKSSLWWTLGLGIFVGIPLTIALVFILT